MERYRPLCLRGQPVGWGGGGQPLNDHYAVCVNGGRVIAERFRLTSYEADLLSELLCQAFEAGRKEMLREIWEGSEHHG